jgi:hypothetical protein
MEPAVSLTEWLDHVTFADLTTEQVTARIIDEVAGWALAQGWRVYRRAPSVVPLPPPMERRFSVLDVACARPAGPPLAIEVDHTDRGRTLEKLRAEADAGRVAIWVRWGPGPFRQPPPPVLMVTCEVSRRARLHTRMPDRPAPEHSGHILGAVAMPIPLETREAQP